MPTFATALLPLLAEALPEPPEVKYTVALITASGVIVSAVVAGVIAFIATRLNQKALAKIQADLAKDNQLALLTETNKNQTKLEELRTELNKKAEQELEELRAKLAEQKTEKDARRAYQFEAHKKLYEQCEPLLFQLAELAEGPVQRVGSLARTARDGALPRWLQGNGYYKLSTVYRLIAPLVVLRLFQQRLTFVDLSLDPHIATQYALLKLSYLVWKDDFEFARMDPRIEYDPHAREPEGAGDRDRGRPLQGLVLGVLDNTIDALLTGDPQRPWLNFGEFEAAVRDPDSKVCRAFRSFSSLLEAFHPRTRPVLWRVLVTQRLIYSKILESRTAGDGTFARAAPAQVSPRRSPRGLDWRTPTEQSTEDGVSEEEAVHVPLRVAQEYLSARLPSVFGEQEKAPAKAPRDA